MARYQITIATMLCLSIVVMAQESHWSVSPCVGLTASKFTETDLFPMSNSYDVGWAFGAEADYKFAGKWHLSMGTMYNRRVSGSEAVFFFGAAMHGKDAAENIVTRSEYNIRMDLLCVPVMMHLELVKNLSIGVGFQPSLLLSAKQYAPADGYFYVDESGVAYLSPFPHEKKNLEKGTSIDITNRCRDLGVEIPVGVVYRYKNLKAEFRYSFGLFNAIYGNDTQTRCFLIGLGWCFSLKQ